MKLWISFGKFELDHLSKAQKQLVMEIINKNKSIFAQTVKDNRV